MKKGEKRSALPSDVRVGRARYARPFSRLKIDLASDAPNRHFSHPISRYFLLRCQWLPRTSAHKAPETAFDSVSDTLSSVPFEAFTPALSGLLLGFVGSD